jgi:DNA repair exonuclease SbcCD ATPase subunit/DNA repair exonuclease SbcCD nuclease subunit
MRFVHVSDIHCRILKYHKEYRTVFQQLYEQLKCLEPDIIVVTGDIGHSKLQLSPESVQLVSEFLTNLASCTETHIILGNHDLSVRSVERLDAITPIVERLTNPKPLLHKFSGEVLLNENFAFNVYSILDVDKWQQPTDPKRVNIALYHGGVKGCKTDLGWTLERGAELAAFVGCDYGFLGDLHTCNQFADEQGRFRYAGSMIQQSFAEDVTKGFLVWDILDKERFGVRFVALENPRPFVTVMLASSGALPESLSVPEDCHLRLISEHHVATNVLRETINIARAKWKPESVIFLNRAAGIRSELQLQDDSLNLRDVAIQERLIREYLVESCPPEAVLEATLELNRKYNATVLVSEDEIQRGVHWKLKRLEWGYLFNYGEYNCIDFTNLHDIVGILGANRSGKTSAGVDCLLYTLFNATSKGNRKNLHVINQHADQGWGRVIIEADGKEYTIYRVSTKYTKKLYGVETLEAKTDVDFFYIDAVTGEKFSLNGQERNETDKNIRKYFGTVEDFLLTNLSAQHGALIYLLEGSTRRKEILAKFLDLELFDKKFKLAKEDAAEIKGVLKKLEGTDYAALLRDVVRRLAYNEQQIALQKQTCSTIQNTLEQTAEQLDSLQKSLLQIPAEIVDIKKAQEQLTAACEQRSREREQQELLQIQQHALEEYVIKSEHFLAMLDLSKLQTDNKSVNELEQQLQVAEHNLVLQETAIVTAEQKASLLRSVPCGPKLWHCKFVCDARQAKTFLQTQKQEQQRAQEKRDLICQQLNALEPIKIKSYLDKYETIIQKKQSTDTKLSVLKLDIQKLETSKAKLDAAIADLERQVAEYAAKRNIIEGLDELLQKQRIYKEQQVAQKEEAELANQRLLEIIKAHGALEQEHHAAEIARSEYLALSDKYAAYDLLQRCMHSNGISYDIIRQKLPVVNQEIAQVLAGVVNFEVFFEDDGNKLDIFIRHPKHEARPIEMGSGSEKAIAAMAIRLGLTKISTLPSYDLFILDEPATELDAETMEGFTRMLEMIRSRFKLVFLISHIDSLKDVVDDTIDIMKKKGYAHVSV